MREGEFKPLGYGAILFLLCFGVQTLTFYIVSRFTDTGTADTALAVNFGAQVLACLVALLVIASLGGRDHLVRAGLTLRGALRGTALAACSYPAFLIFFLLVIVPINNLIVGDVRQELVEDIMSQPELLASIPFLLLVSLAVPILEEFLFRGILYPGLRAGLAMWPAVLFSGLIFALLHGFNAAFPILAFGCYLGVIREKNSSLLPAICVHVLHNSATLILLHRYLYQ